MSVLVAGGARWAVGLRWLLPSDRRAARAAARAYGRPFAVRWGGQTGLGAGGGVGAGRAPKELDSVEGLPSLAAAVGEHVVVESWTALVEGQGGRYAVMQRQGGVMLAEERVFEDKEKALAAFEAAREGGGALYATPGLVGGAVDLDAGNLVDADAIRLRPAAPGRRPWRWPWRWWWWWVAAAPCAVVGVFVGLGLWERWWPPSPSPPSPAAPPTVMAVVDSGRLLAACVEGLRRLRPAMPGWRTASVSCHSRFADPNLVRRRPDMAGKPVMVARFRLASGRNPPLHRQVAQDQLLAWDESRVDLASAWAAAVLPPVLRRAGPAPPPFVVLRRHADRRLGLHGVALDYQTPQAAPGGAAAGGAVRLSTRLPLPRLAGLLEAVPGLEVTDLSLGAGGAWSLAARPAAPLRMREAAFLEETAR